MDFRSDNTHGCSPEILEALARANAGTMTSYGKDDVTARLRELCCELFETDVDVFPILTGTAGNALSIAAMTPPAGVVLCHDAAHIHRDEMGAPEFYTNGAKLIPIDGANGKLDVDVVSRAITNVQEGGWTGTLACLSLTQATESGTVYTAEELGALCELAHGNGMRVHLDGARFANALASQLAAPADLSWRAGADMLVFGGTKNGAMAAELVVSFRKELSEELAMRWHRSGHRLSKMRFLSAQLEAYLSGDLWLRNARHANAMARRLAEGIGGAVEIVRPVEANIVFAKLPDPLASELLEQGFQFLDWPLFGPGVVRLVTAFDTIEAEVDAFVKAVVRS